jgi:hypothetical protein
MPLTLTAEANFRMAEAGIENLRDSLIAFRRHGRPYRFLIMKTLTGSAGGFRRRARMPGRDAV